MSENILLPDWPRGTVAVLSTAGPRPHAIPVSALRRAGNARILLALARRRQSLQRLRDDPAVTVTILARGVAVSADGTAAVLDEQLTEATAAVAVDVDALHDHDRPTFTLQAGVGWEWADADARRADEAVHAALARLAAG